MATKHQVFDTLRMSPKDIQRLVEDLERRGSQEVAGTHRQSRRWKMRSQRVIVTLVGQMGQRLNILVIPRNLSQGGMGFICGNYLHIGSSCFVTFRSLGGKGVVVQASVRRCKHVEGRLHEIGVEFGEQIDPRNYMIDTDGQHLFNAERVELTELDGRVLIVVKDPIEQRLLGHYLADSNIDLLFGSTKDRGLLLLEEEPDLVFVDAKLPDGTGLEFLESMREYGQKCPAVLMSTERDETLRSTICDFGGNEVIFKPITADLMQRAAAEYLIPATRAKQAPDKNIKPDEQNGTMNRSLRIDYAGDLRTIADAITAAMDSAETEVVCERLELLQATAPGFGFQSIAHLATAALCSIRQGREEHCIRREIDRLNRSLRTVNAA